MEKFQRLSRTEMKKVIGGVNGQCPTGKSCSIYVNDGDGHFFPVSGNCAIANGGCNCVAGDNISGSTDCN